MVPSLKSPIISHHLYVICICLIFIDRKVTYKFSIIMLFTTSVFFFFSKTYLFDLSLAVLGLRCCALAFSSCGERRLLFVAVRGLLIAGASLVAEHRL